MNDRKTFNSKIDNYQLNDGMKSENILLTSPSFKDIDIARCCICDKTIRALDDMKIGNKFYCSKCKIDYYMEKSKIDILCSRKKELLYELKQINNEIDQLSNNLRF